MKLIYRNVHDSEYLSFFDGHEVKIIQHPHDEVFPTYLVEAVGFDECFIAWDSELFIYPDGLVPAKKEMLVAA